MKSPRYLAQVASLVADFDRRILGLNDAIILCENTDLSGMSAEEIDEHLDTLERCRSLKDAMIEMLAKLNSLSGS
jgi:hypothetical protein